VLAEQHKLLDGARSTGRFAAGERLGPLLQAKAKDGAGNSQAGAGGSQALTARVHCFAAASVVRAPGAGEVGGSCGSGSLQF
jgi:hypothetical protein